MIDCERLPFRVRMGLTDALLWLLARLVEVSWLAGVVLVVLVAALLVAVVWFIGSFWEAVLIAETVEDLWQ